MIYQNGLFVCFKDVLGENILVVVKNERVVRDLIDHVYLHSSKRKALNILKSNPDILFSDEFLSEAISQEYFDIMFEFFRVAERLKIIGKKEISFYFNNRSPKTGETILTCLLKKAFRQHKTIERALTVKAADDIIEIEKNLFRDTVANLDNVYKYSKIYNINPNVCNYRQQYPIDMIKKADKSSGYDFFVEDYKVFSKILASYDDKKKEKFDDSLKVHLFDVSKVKEHKLYIRDISHRGKPVVGVNDENISQIRFRLLSSNVPFYLLEDLNHEYVETEIYPAGDYAYISSVGSFFKKIVVNLSKTDQTVDHFFEKDGELVPLAQNKIMSYIKSNV